MKPKIIADHSKFWLGDKYSPAKSFDLNSTMDLIKLAAYRRAIGNFVYILTGKNIPVRFAEKATSQTDGRVIYIGGELSKGEFDPTVGLSLHEAMHIAKSDFELVKLVWMKVPKSLKDAAKGRYTSDALGTYAKFVLNVVEDRYIDAWAWKHAPGYRGYYESLYNRYFYLDQIGVGLKSDDYREPTLKNYRFRLVNIIHPDADLNALPGLRRISAMLDVDNMLRPELDKPSDRLDLAFAITEEIIKNVVEAREEEQKEQREKQKSDDAVKGQSSDSSDDKEEEEDTTEEQQDSTGGDESEDEKSDGDEPAEEDGADDSDEGNDEEPTDDSNTGNQEEDILGGVEACSDPAVEDIEEEEAEQEKETEPTDLTEEEVKKIEKIIEQQEEFIERRLKPTNFDDDTIKKLNVLEKSDVAVVAVGGEEGVPETDCVVIRNMTRELMFSGDFPLANRYTSEKVNAEASKGVQEGVAFGTMLGRKLQIRSEVKHTKFTRLPKGRIDRRLLSAIGYNGENLFYQTATDKFKNVHLHVSVDASSSMSNKWRKTISTVVALAKAASMINNVSMSISFRTGSGVQENEMAYVVIAYDSRKDKFSKITELFPLLFPYGSTPEGLAFQAILHNIPETTHDLDSYFVNLSDGEPAFNTTFLGGGYCGETAANHTRKQVNKIRESGVMVLSYFIEEDAPKPEKSEDEESDPFIKVKNARVENNTTLFKTMYGKDAHFIDVSSIVQVAHTMNQKFLSKEN